MLSVQLALGVVLYGGRTMINDKRAGFDAAIVWVQPGDITPGLNAALDNFPTFLPKSRFRRIGLCNSECLQDLIFSYYCDGVVVEDVGELLDVQCVE